MKHIKLFEQYSNNSNFDTWFGESKMTENCKPKVYYHGVGRAGKFNKFRKDLLGSSSGNLGHYGEGFYFAPSYKEAKIWSKSLGGTGEVLEVYLKIENPFVVTRENLLNIGEKYDLNIPNKKEVGIEKESVLVPLRKYDPISADFLELIFEVGYKKAWRIFLDEKADLVDSAKIDLNTISDWSEFFEPDEYRGVNDYIIDEMREIGIEPKIKYDYPENIAMHYLTELGHSALEWTKSIKAEGYDGIDAGSEIVVFEPNQIKSIENNGSFSTTNDNIYESLNSGLTKSEKK